MPTVTGNKAHITKDPDGDLMVVYPQELVVTFLGRQIRARYFPSWTKALQEAVRARDVLAEQRKSGQLIVLHSTP